MNAAQKYKVEVYAALGYKFVGLRGVDIIVARKLRAHERRSHTGMDILVQIIGVEGKTIKTLVRRRSEARKHAGS